MSVGTNIQTINFNKPVQQNTQTTFRSQTVPVKDYPPDAVEINGKKKSGMSNSVKWGIGIGLATLGTILAIALTKGKGATKEIKQLAEHIEFKEAKTNGKFKVVMAAGTFTQGSSIELSCDGPIRKPYIGIYALISVQFCR